MKRAALLFISGCAAVCAAATGPDSVTHRLKPLEVMGVKQSSAGIAAEAVTYALAGCVIGYVVGAAIGKLLFNILIQEHFVYAVWTPPVFRLLIVVVFAVAAMLAAIYTPSKRMRNMAVTETINEL